MRILVALAVVAVALAAPASARAGEARLWACHGPNGAALPASFDTRMPAGTSVKSTSSDACSTPADTIRVLFTNPAPADGTYASLRLNAPPDVQVQSVRLVRSVTGPGYFARTSTMDLEALDAAGTLDGVFEGPASGSWVELGLRCAGAGCDMTGAQLDFSALALGVRDDLPPSFSLGDLPSYAAGVTGLVVDARDTGLGLASARATLDGVPVGATALGQAACSELSPGDATIDLPLAEGCPAARRTVLTADSTLVADGTHRLEVTVTDGAGNVSVQRSELKVVNHPPVTVTPTPVPTRTPVPTATPTPVPSQAALTPAKRYTVTKRGALAAEVSCPARATSNCPVSLTLRAKLPGRKRAATIASRHTSLKPGAKTPVTVKLSAAARRAVAKRSLRATLTLAGARPASVTLVPVRRE